jgi:hypothetical protein
LSATSLRRGRPGPRSGKLRRLRDHQIFQRNLQCSCDGSKRLYIAGFRSVLNLGNKTLSYADLLRKGLLGQATVLPPECQRRPGSEQRVGLLAGQQGFGPAGKFGKDSIGMRDISGVFAPRFRSQSVILCTGQDHDVISLRGFGHNRHLVSLFVDSATRSNVQNGNCRPGFREQDSKVCNTKPFCGATGQLDDIVGQRSRVGGVLIDLRPDLAGTIAVSSKVPKGNPRPGYRLHRNQLSPKEIIVNSL